MSKREGLMLAMILKDEGETIRDVIKSFHRDDGTPMYDRIVIGIDDSTVDNTEEVVREFTDDIHHFTWEKNFAKTRNDLLKKCQKYDTPWIMMPDGHEALHPASRIAIEGILHSDRQDLWLISPYVHLYDNTKYCCHKQCSTLEIPEYTFPRPMFLRNNGKVWFKRAIHNFLDCDDKHKVIIGEINFIHKMPAWRLKNREKQRTEMNTEGLLEKLKENPDDSRDLFYLGNTYGDSQQLDKALVAYEKCLEQAGSPDFIGQIRIMLGHICCVKGEFEKANKYLVPALDMDGKWDRAEIWFLLGWSAQGRGEWLEAINWYTCCVSMSRGGFPISSYFLNPEMYTWFPLDGLMDCKCKTGDLDGALEAVKEIKKMYKPECKTVDENIKSITDALMKQKGDNFAKSFVKGMSPKDLNLESITANFHKDYAAEMQANPYE